MRVVRNRYSRAARVKLTQLTAQLRSPRERADRRVDGPLRFALTRLAVWCQLSDIRSGFC